jgi:hypothetical protein
MDDARINADRTQFAVVHGGQLAWTPSPEAGIERRLLERIGGEVALATSIVRYRAGHRFPSHVHGLGEEFFVLGGTFSDEHGHHSSGTYVRNPPGSRHAPYSDDGCVIFVKLRQMHAADRQSIRVSSEQLKWSAESPGHNRAPLFDMAGVSVRLEWLAPGASRAELLVSGGEEIFVINGDLSLAGLPQPLTTWSWLRHPDSRCRRMSTDTGALYWRKTGHLAPGPGIRDG